MNISSTNILGWCAAIALIATATLATPEISETDQSASFTFVAFGDRTGGPNSGVDVLGSAVEMTNWLDPDLVMTVGDLIEGQCSPSQWIEQADEFRAIMNELKMPWFPVAGNHDVYTKPRTEGGFTDQYRKHFGPMTYSFDHKFAHFIVLFTDEAMDYDNPSQNQNMSQAQMDWLRDDLASTDARQIFVFLHHPRWTKQYNGCDWDRVHEIFAADNRPTTVVGGHIHTLRDDGTRDNVHYLTLATTGGWLKRGFDYASMHHITQFTVRPDRVSIVHLPMESILPSEAYPGIEFDEIKVLQKGGWVSTSRVNNAEENSREQLVVRVTITNPTERNLDFKIGAYLPVGWEPEPLASLYELKPGATETLDITVHAPQSMNKSDVSSFEIVARAYYPHGNGSVQPVSIRKELTLVVLED